MAGMPTVNFSKVATELTNSVSARVLNLNVIPLQNMILFQRHFLEPILMEDEKYISVCDLIRHKKAIAKSTKSDLAIALSNAVWFSKP